MSIITRGLIFATDFPKNPLEGDLAVIHNIIYVWTGIVWANTGQNGTQYPNGLSEQDVINLIALHAPASASGLTQNDVLNLIAANPSGFQWFTTAYSCVNDGPGVSGVKTRVYKSPLGEYWLWLGDNWKVVAGMATVQIGAPSQAITAGDFVQAVQIFAPRAGKAHIRGIGSCLNTTGALNSITGFIHRQPSGWTGTQVIENSIALGFSHINGQYTQVRPEATITINAGDAFYLHIHSNGAPMAASPTHASSLHIEYIN